MLCKLCARINVTDLVHLAKINYKNLQREHHDRAPEAPFLSWRHYAQYEDLVVAAQVGCELCQLLLGALNEKIRSPEGGGLSYRDALLEMEKAGTSMGFNITIDSKDEEFRGSMGPGMIPRDRAGYLKGRFAGVGPSKYSNALGNSSASATLNAIAPAPSMEIDNPKSKPREIKSSPQYITSYKDIILDRLSFHVGIKGPGQKKQSLNPLIFSLQVPRGQAKFVGPLHIGHFALDPDLGSETNFGIARDWIKTCVEEHDECPSMEDKPLPSRVINVGSDDRKPFLVLTNRGNGKFIALSHCWGGSVAEKAKLTTKSAESFKDEIPMANLPANFVDAVLITRSLGFEYLWIDCLCIMQDSREDWDVESKHMGNIYRDAIITIAAAAAPKATDGMLHTFSSYDLSGGPPVKLKLSSDSSPEDDVDIVQRDSTREDLGHLLRHGPLANRGWTLQEEVLSPRTLYYGLQQIHWQCLRQYSSADGIHDYDVHWKRAFRYERIKDRIFKQTHSPDHDPHDPKNINQLLIEYHDEMVVDYCSRSLTFPSDKFPAFSGIATLVHNELRHGGYLNSVYLAGIWSSHLREGLIWYFGEDATSFMSHSHSHSHSHSIIPSWSWATVTGAIKNLHTKMLLPTALDPSLHSHNITPASVNPYGAITGGELVIDGCTLPMRVAEHGVKYPTSGDMFWDPDPEVAREWGRKSQVWKVEREGVGSWLVVGRGDGGEEEEEEEWEKEKEKKKEKPNLGNFKKLPYKVLFIASQNRYAFGLVLKKVAGKNATSNANTEVRHRVRDADKDTAKTTSSTVSRSRGEDPDDMEADCTAKGLTNTDLQDVNLSGPDAEADLDLDLDSEIPTYRRIGLIKLQTQVVTKRWNLDPFKWLDMKWERQKLRLV
ncbi:hypothetical protein NHQ30_009771 [Ciborinia camelliae]|nr:hypothetical protein NHQ30_009771 [Ciborinia camelliae]